MKKIACILFFILSCSLHAVSPYIDVSPSQSLIRDPIGQGDYLNPQFIKHIDPKAISLILEIGSRDCIDALDLSRFYKAHVYAFECNPQAIEICRHNIGMNPNITLVPFAAWNETTQLTFYPTIPGGELCVIGTSSLFKFDPQGPVRNSQLQGEVTVEAVRLDEWLASENISKVDLVCIDAQGATLQVLQGLEEYLPKIKYIIAEAEFQRFYLGEALYPEIVQYLSQHRFEMVTQINHHGLYADVLFVNRGVP
jgi:FkbM family methyltransferase